MTNVPGSSRGLWPAAGAAGLALVVLAWTSCTSIRRTDEGQTPTWSAPLPAPAPEAPRPLARAASDTTAAVLDSAMAAARRAATDSSMKGVRIMRRQRTSSARERVAEVNEYAYWCIGKEMWNEAKSHLERAVAEDSLAASLNNNLAIVYEHLGERQQAARLYARAAALEPDNEEYRANLEHLNELERAAGDTTGNIDLFELRRRAPMGPGGPARPQ